MVVNAQSEASTPPQLPSTTIETTLIGTQTPVEPASSPPPAMPDVFDDDSEMANASDEEDPASNSPLATANPLVSFIY